MLRRKKQTDRQTNKKSDNRCVRARENTKSSVLILEARYYSTACIAAPGTPTEQRICRISILTAGTADLPVAEEAAELCDFGVRRLWNVACIQRLLTHRDVIRNADVLVVVTGMEGALPSVVAGLTDAPVIAVPTSIGFGTNLGGVSAMLPMLNSCATGVLNIDTDSAAPCSPPKFSAHPPPPTPNSR